MSKEYLNVKVFPQEKFSPASPEKKFGFFHNLFSNNERIVDTSGFVPLTVRIKQMMLSGAIHAINSDAFDSSDYEEMYSDLHQNTVELGDDFEDLNEKARLVAERRQEILERKGLIPSAAERTAAEEEQKQPVNTEKSKDKAKEPEE